MKNSILIVDDDKISQAIISKILRDSGQNYVLYTADNGETAIKVAKEKQPGLILMDWEMPVLSGIEALEMLKRNEITREIPVIMETGMVSSEKLELAFGTGAIDYIRKPVDKTELIARVKSALALYNSFLEIKQKNEQIQRHIEELEKLSIIAEQTDNSVLLIKPTGEIEWVNKGFMRMHEYQLEEYKQYFGEKIVDIEDKTPEEIIEEFIKKRRSATFQSVAETKSGDFKWIQTRITPIFEEYTGQIKRFIAIQADITKLKESERELKHRNDGLVKLTHELLELNLQLETEKLSIEKRTNEIEQEKEVIEQEKTKLMAEKAELEDEKERTEALLFNIMPEHVAIQLKSTGSAKPRDYKMATVLFTDFKGFTHACEKLTPKELVNALHSYFVRFDNIIQNHFIEKIKTIGDAYMCVGGVPIRNRSNPFNVVLAALEIQQFMNSLDKFKRDERFPVWKLRLGLHTGPVIAGVVGKTKFAYDIWGDTVNIAARMEQSGVVGKVNISGSTYDIVGKYFNCEYRGKIEAKNKGKVDMYFIHGLKSDYSHDENRVIPNSKFLQMLNDM